MAKGAKYLKLKNNGDELTFRVVKGKSAVQIQVENHYGEVVFLKNIHARRLRDWLSFYLDAVD